MHETLSAGEPQHGPDVLSTPKEQREQPREIEIEVLELPGKYPMIAIDAKDKEEVEAFNKVVAAHFKIEFSNKDYWHQIGSGKDKGRQAWEVWGDKEDIRGRLQELIPTIKTAVEAILNWEEAN